MTNYRPVYILPFVNYNVYWPMIGHLYCITSLLIKHYELPRCNSKIWRLNAKEHEKVL